MALGLRPHAILGTSRTVFPSTDLTGEKEHLFFSVNTVLEVDCIEEDYEDRRERDPTLASLNVPSPPKMLDLDPNVEMHAITKVCLSYVYEGLSK